MLVCTTDKDGNIVGSNTPRNQNRLIRNQDLLQGISHGSIFGGTPRDSEQRSIFRREGICIDIEFRRRMNLDPACGTDKNRSP